MAIMGSILLTELKRKFFLQEIKVFQNMGNPSHSRIVKCGRLRAAIEAVDGLT